MSEADSEASGETTEAVEESGFDMESAQDAISDSLFPKDEAENDDELDFDEEDEVSDIDKELKEELKEESEKKEEEPEVEKIDLPASWKKDMQEKWGKLDVDAQKYVIEREEQMKSGLEQDRVDSNLGRTMRDIMTPYQALFQERGIEGPQAVKNLLDAHHALSGGTIEQKQSILSQLAQSYGITEPKEGENPQVVSLTQRLAQIEQNLNASQQRSLQDTQTRIESEVSAFADEHPLFDELESEIADFIKVGYDLDDAYEKALWANPATRQKELDRLETEKTAESDKIAKQEAEAAKKAKSVNVKGRESRKAPTGKLGTMEDTMRDTYREIKSRN